MDQHGYHMGTLCHGPSCIHTCLLEIAVSFRFRQMIPLHEKLFRTSEYSLLLRTLNKACKKRMCMVRSGLEFRMSLCSYKERMSGNFDHLNDMCIRGSSYDGHSFFT